MLRDGFNWNNAARVAWEFAAPLSHSNAAPTRAMTYNDDNQIATFNGQNVSYDADGNMTSGPLTNDTLATYTYDARNRLLSAGGLSYGYDPSANRVAITNGTNVTRFVINPNAALSQVLLRVKNGVTNYYVYGLGLLYETDNAGNTKTYHYDYRGSTVAITDGDGTVTDRAEYSAYGSLTYRTGATDTPFLFNGRYGVQTDANGLLHMRARYYSPYLCRFLNQDHLGFAGGLNFYAYADGNPVSYLDPFGLSTVRISVGIDGGGTREITLVDPSNDSFRNQINSLPGESIVAIEFVGHGSRDTMLIAPGASSDGIVDLGSGGGVVYSDTGHSFRDSIGGKLAPGATIGLGGCQTADNGRFTTQPNISQALSAEFPGHPVTGFAGYAIGNELSNPFNRDQYIRLGTENYAVGITRTYVNGQSAGMNQGQYLYSNTSTKPHK